GLGAESVSGRSRVPLPPTRTTASTAVFATSPPPFCRFASATAQGAAHHQVRTHPQRGPQSPAQRGPPPTGIPVGQENIGALVMCGQVACRVVPGGVPLMVQNLGRRHVDGKP